MSTMTRRTRRVAVGLAAAAGLLVAQSATASAEDFVSIPVSGVVTGPEGSELLVASDNVPAEYIGQTCEVVGQTVNQESVHDNNDLLIVTGGQTLTIPNFEDEGFITYEAGEISEISSTIEVYVRFGPDEVSSGGFQLRVTCDGVDVPPAGPTTVPPAPTTTVPPETTTTAPPTTAPTTAPTTVPTTAPTTAPPPAGPETEAQLPVTGSETALIALAGIFLIAAGVASRDVAKSRISGLFDN